jgi:hypothetical protein
MAFWKELSWDAFELELCWAALLAVEFDELLLAVELGPVVFAAFDALLLEELLLAADAVLLLAALSLPDE